MKIYIDFDRTIFDTNRFINDILVILENYGINISIISNALDSSFLVVIYLVAIFIGISIGTLSSLLAISKYLNASPKRTKRK